MRIAFCHHLSLSYGGGGEKWIVQLANELVKRGHTVTIYCLPFTMTGAMSFDFKSQLNTYIKYHESLFHFVDADVAYITYHPLNWLSFFTKAPKIGGMHSHAYWKPLDVKYGLLPNLAIAVNALTSRWELAHFKIIHNILDEYPINHPNIKTIPNFVDESKYKLSGVKHTEFTVGFASRKNWQKGYDIWEELKVLLKNNGINTIETGNVPENEMPRFFSQCHVISVPARVDTFGITIIESIFCGSIPVTSSLVTHRALSLPLFYADTSESMLKRILEVKEMWDGGIYVQYQNILLRQAEKFQKDKVINSLEKMFEEACKC